MEGPHGQKVSTIMYLYPERGVSPEVNVSPCLNHVFSLYHVYSYAFIMCILMLRNVHEMQQLFFNAVSLH